MTDPHNGARPSTRAKLLLKVVEYVGPSVFAIVTAYTSVTSLNSAWQQRVVTLENEVVSLRKEVEANREKISDTRERYVTREEVMRHLEQQSQTLDSIRRAVERRDR
jgi:hypothetical protein